ncbi:ATP-binding protein [Pyrolobus fumarii]|uniref:ATP-binding protein n=1 Tax=Pyrolobus fumarii TaxID=54252 RepID=UPI001FCB298A|nr:ATP-binding protein [Pyrolobus fumarii]
MYNGGVFVDAGYRTLLGTGFYDRREELERIAELLRAVRTLVIYGPRNVGKSELVRYFIARRLGRGALTGLTRRVVIVDARQRRVERYFGVERGLLGLLEEMLSSVTGLPRGLVGLLEELVSRLRPPILVFIDEFHLLFRGSLGDALVELEAVAGFLAKRGEEQIRLVVTVSEGFFATLGALHRLLGYSVGYLLVEPMSVGAFKALYEEYRGKHGCSIGFDLLTRLAGTSPGYLVDLCPRSGSLLEEWVLGELQRLSAALDLAAEAAGISREEAVRVATRLLRGEPAETPRERRLGEKLVEMNIAYPCQARLQRIYLPQLPLYKVALETAVNTGLENMDLDLQLIAGYEQFTLKRCSDIVSRPAGA